MRRRRSRGAGRPGHRPHRLETHDARLPSAVRIARQRRLGLRHVMPGQLLEACRQRHVALRKRHARDAAASQVDGRTNHAAVALPRNATRPTPASRISARARLTSPTRVSTSLAPARATTSSSARVVDRFLATRAPSDERGAADDPRPAPAWIPRPARCPFRPHARHDTTQRIEQAQGHALTNAVRGVQGDAKTAADALHVHLLQHARHVQSTRLDALRSTRDQLSLPMCDARACAVLGIAFLSCPRIRSFASALFFHDRAIQRDIVVLGHGFTFLHLRHL